jgi:hypothetical protein
VRVLRYGWVLTVAALLAFAARSAVTPDAPMDGWDALLMLAAIAGVLASDWAARTARARRRR